MQHLKVAAFCCLSLAMHVAVAASPAEQPALVVSDDGLFIVDAKARQVWSRCVEGMRWDGQACAGEPRLATYAEALSLASARARRDGLRWRVPRVKELQLITGKAMRIGQGKGQVLLPATPGDWLWTESANIDTRPVNQYDYRSIERGVNAHNANSLAFLHGWAVNQQTGEARGDMLKRARLPVRLVRTEK